MTVAQQLGTDGPWWLELSRYLPYPVLLAPAVVALLLAVPLGRGWIAVAAAAVALVLTVAMGLAWRIGEPGEASLRVMTWNAKVALARDRAGGLAALAEEVEAQHPDILVLQDANAVRHIGLAPGAPLFGMPLVYAAGQYAIASRAPMRDCAESRAGDGGDALAFVRCTVEAGGATFDLITVHFESPRSGLVAARREGFDGVHTWRRNHELRLAQSRALARMLGPRTRPLVLAGDLNAPESSSVVRNLLATGLRDAFSSAGRGWGYTYGHTLRPAFSFLRIDHVLVSREIDVANAFAGGKDASTTGR